MEPSLYQRRRQDGSLLENRQNICCIIGKGGSSRSLLDLIGAYAPHTSHMLAQHEDPIVSSSNWCGTETKLTQYCTFWENMLWCPTNWEIFSWELKLLLLPPLIIRKQARFGCSQSHCLGKTLIYKTPLKLVTTLIFWNMLTLKCVKWEKRVGRYSYFFLNWAHREHFNRCCLNPQKKSIFPFIKFSWLWYCQC